MKFTSVQDYPINQLRCEKPYQRSPNRRTWQDIAESIREDGYCPARPILITEDMNIFDGQHRWIAAKSCGIKKIPCCIVSGFKDEQEEAKFFAQINNYSSRLKPIDYWEAKRQAGDPLAQLLYDLAENPKSLLYHHILLRGHKYDENFSIGTCFVFIYTALCHSTETWDSKNELARTKTILKIPEHERIEKINKFVEFFFDCFGKKRVNNRLAFMCDSVRPFGLFYLRLQQTAFFEDAQHNRRIYALAVEMMKTFVFPAKEWRGMSYFTKFACFASHWNKKRSKTYPVDTSCNIDIEKK